MTVWTSHTFPDWEMPLKLTTDAESVGEVDPGAVVSQTVSLIAPLTDVQGHAFGAQRLVHCAPWDRVVR